jgi:Caudovirus prohead serine protease
MKADFSGWATKAGLECSDGRTIMPNAFAHQDKIQVPLVWQHGHTDPQNVLGHVLLENRPEGVYCSAFFNETPRAQHAKELVKHKDINALSIWANQLVEKARKVIHGTIREVSLVMAGANPGALIDSITITHGDGELENVEDEAIIYTGLTLEHTDGEDEEEPVNNEPIIEHAEGESLEDVYNSMTDKQKEVLHYMLGVAVEEAKSEMAQSALADFEFDDDEAKAVYESMSQEQQTVLQHMLSDAIEFTKSTIETTNTQEGTLMHRNVFEKGDTPAGPSLSHDDVKSIVADATRCGSLREAVSAYALAHGIENIDVLFPDAVAVDNIPEFLKRRTEWVNVFMSAATKSPFARIKTLHADITMEEARAKGYVTGSLKKEEFFAVSRRITVPTTIYKKQKLDRDDMIDINDFDVVAWLKGEMRLMLDEEIARAALLSDGRDVSHEDKINEGNIRPIAKDHELYNTLIYVNIDDSNSSVTEIIDQVILNRGKFRGTGQPIMFTTETLMARFMLLKDTLGRRIYRNMEELASELRVSQIIPVEVMEEYPEILAVLVNPVDYRFGSDKGGNVAMFDDFDIDYNQYKYLIETRLSGALAKMKSAMTVMKVAASAVLVVPAAPTFDPETGALTIVNTTGVVYKNAAGTVINAAGSPYTVAPGASYTVNATPASASYYFATSDDDSWTFTADA